MSMDMNAFVILTDKRGIFAKYINV